MILKTEEMRKMFELKKDIHCILYITRVQKKRVQRLNLDFPSHISFIPYKLLYFL